MTSAHDRVIVLTADPSKFWNSKTRTFQYWLTGDYTTYRTPRMVTRTANELHRGMGYRVEIRNEIAAKNATYPY